MSADQSMLTTYCSDERNFADSGEMCSGVVILGLVLAGSGTGKAGQQGSTPHPCTVG